MNDAANTKRLYKVVANGSESMPLHLGAANRIAKALRAGTTGGRKHTAPLYAKVVAA